MTMPEKSQNGDVRSGHSNKLHVVVLVLLVLIVVAVGIRTVTANNDENVKEIRLNQIGFYIDGPKVAVVTGEEGDEFYVISVETRDTVYTGSLGEPAEWPHSGETVRIADFSAFKEPGVYVVMVDGYEESPAFRIGESVHGEVADAAVKAFYYQRMSTPLEPEHAGKWARKGGHPDTLVLIHPSAASESRPEGSTISAPKGWYDAGDYNKYIVNSGITTYTLLLLYQQYPEYVTSRNLNIPESGNELPDLLDEVLWNIRWMVAMQDPADGGVYHKLTAPEFEAFIPPDQAKKPRYVVQKSTAAALNFAAVMAQASRVFREYEHVLPAFSDTLREAAIEAWKWARRNPEVLYDQMAMNRAYDPDVTTGAYGDRFLQDEWRWAAVELFLATRQDSFLTAVDEPATWEVNVPSWNNVGTLGIYSLLDNQTDLAGRTEVQALKDRFIEWADQMLASQEASAYRVVMGLSERDFVWGSSSVAANQGLGLIQAYRLTGDRRYLEGAISNLDYLLGRNATGYSFATGYGTKTPMNPHHRLPATDDVPEPIPGFLVGGPNPGQQDQCEGYPSKLPARSYIDDVCSYASNEIAINWNAPFAYLTNAVEAEMNR